MFTLASALYPYILMIRSNKVSVLLSTSLPTRRSLQLVTPNLDIADIMSSPASSTNAEQPAIHAVTVKLPPFSTQEPISWFRRAEVQFRLRNVSNEQTKADYVLEAVPDTVFPQVSAWLDDQPDKMEYGTLKNYLQDEFTLSPSTRAQRLLQFPSQPLGDRTAHQAWNEMQALARLPDIDQVTKKHKQVDLMRELWLQTLPSHVRAALPNAENTDMKELVRQADLLIDAANASHRPAAISRVSKEAPADATTARRRRPQEQHSSPTEVCFYHAKFGAAARKCLPGCQWTKNE